MVQVSMPGFGLYLKFCVADSRGVPSYKSYVDDVVLFCAAKADHVMHLHTNIA